MKATLRSTNTGDAWLIAQVGVAAAGGYGGKAGLTRNLAPCGPTGGRIGLTRYSTPSYGIGAACRCRAVGGGGVVSFYGVLHAAAATAARHHVTTAQRLGEHGVENLAGNALNYLFSYLHTRSRFLIATFPRKGLPTPCHSERSSLCHVDRSSLCHVDRSGDISRDSSTTLGMTNGWRSE